MRLIPRSRLPTQTTDPTPKVWLGQVQPKTRMRVRASSLTRLRRSGQEQPRFGAAPEGAQQVTVWSGVGQAAKGDLGEEGSGICEHCVVEPGPG